MINRDATSIARDRIIRQPFQFFLFHRQPGVPNVF